MVSDFFDDPENYAPSTIPYEFDWKKTYSFAELGFSDFVFNSSTSKINSTLPVYLTKGKFKSWDVELKIQAKNLGNEKVFLHFYLNNNLIRSFQIGTEDVSEYSFSIPPMPLSVGSYITIEWTNPNGNALPKGAEILVDKMQSFISPIFRDEFPSLFSSFPKNMEAKPIQILVDYELSEEEQEALDELVLILNKRPRNDYRFYFPEIFRIDGPDDLISRDVHMILVTQSPVKYSETFKNESLFKYGLDGLNYKSDELDKFFEKHKNTPLTSMELFEFQGNRILFIANNPFAVSSMKEAIDGMEDEFISNTGNLILADARHYYFFDIRQKELVAQDQMKRSAFENFWVNYRVYITLILVILLWLLLRYIYIKSQNAKKSIEDARR
ncbi:hypothetical protein [Algoriphagus sediminis]|uniref:Uncharacterized protein n=1 Tax=Algoriphagus sediminis TaxID=3057113 RepID=A0ABT7YF52_9BACT|nr:hypothetical protein [Algoriphagus sediminis]MDN3205156.1 hypothetical protein [Algoriphagus sediminis]